MINMLGTIWFFWQNIPLSTKEDLLSAKKKTVDEAKSGVFFWSFWNWTNKTHYNSSCKDKPLYIKYRNLFIRSHIFLHSVVEYRFFWQYLTTHYNKNKSLKEKTKKKIVSNRIKRSIQYKMNVPWLANVLFFFCLFKSLKYGYWRDNLYCSLVGHKLPRDVVIESKNK